MALLSLNLNERPLIYYRTRPLPPRPFRLGSANVSRGVPPFRGLIYSFFVHQVALFSALFLPALENYRTPALPVGDQLFAIDLTSKAKLVYFPNLNPKDDTESSKSKTKQTDEAAAKPRPLRTKGLTYPGPQTVVSDVPNPTNKFQTLLQPALVNPPIIQPPPLPNVIQMADAGPLPPPRPEPTVAKKDLMVPSPSQVALQKQNVVLPKATPAPTLPVPEKPIEPPTPVKKDLTVPAPTLSASQRPNVVLPQSPSAPALPVPEKPIEPPTPVRKDLTIPKPTLSASQRPNVVLPKGPATPAIPIPEKPIELTSVQKDLTIPSPSQVAPSQRQNIALPNATATPALPAPERPIEPPTVARKDLSIPAPSQAPSQARSVVLPGQRTAPDVAAPAQIAAVETHGPDQQNLVSVSPLPAPPQPGALPDGVARGRFAISPDANLSGSGRTPGVKADNVGTTTAGVGKKADGPAAGTTGNAGPSGNGVADKGGTAGATTGTGSSKDGASGNGNGGNGRGNSSGNTPGKTPFPGITVQGGRLEGNGGIVSAPPSPRTLTIGSAPSAVPAGTYGMTVVSNAGTGGGLPDLGVFSHEKVYTVYLDMKKKSGDPGPSWTLQYALMPANPNPNGLIPPFPMVKESPNFAIELVQKNLNQLVVVYAIIDAKGKLQQVSVKQTPDPQLNQAALAALQKWTFRPAEANGRPVSVKVLLGIPVSQP